MNENQPDWEEREDRYWMQGIPKDWPLEEKKSPGTLPKTMYQKQWDYETGLILDSYNDKKISKEVMIQKLKALKKVEIK